MMKKWIVIMTAMSLPLAACSSGQGQGQMSDTEKTVVVAVPVASSYLKESVQKFEQLHPDIHVEIKEYFDAMKSKQDASGRIMQNVSLLEVEKYVQSMTTQILSGKASDLIATDFLPKDKFVNKKVFADIGEWMKQDSAFDKNKYYLFSSQSGNGPYVVPVSFSPDGMVQVNKKLLDQAGISIDDKTWTWDQIGDLSKKLKEKAGPNVYAFLNIMPDYLITGDLKNYYQDGEVSFDSDKFRNAMKQVKSLYDQKAIRIEGDEEYGKGLFKELFTLADLYSPRSALVTMLNPETAVYRKPSFAGQPGGIGYQASEAYAINNKSEVKQEAWMFLSFMLSEEMQQSAELQGFPVNKAASLNKIQQARQQIENPGGKQEASDSTIPFPLPDASAFDQSMEMLQSVLEAVEVRESVDLELMNIVSQEFGFYMDGQKNAEEVSKLIQNRAATYLNE